MNLPLGLDRNLIYRHGAIFLPSESPGTQLKCKQCGDDWEGQRHQQCSFRMLLNKGWKVLPKRLQVGRGPL